VKRLKENNEFKCLIVSVYVFWF